MTVALGGDGADELLAGYPTFPADRVAGYYHMPRLLHEQVVAPLADRVPVSTKNFSLDFKLKRFVRAAKEQPDMRHPLWLGSFSPDEQARLLMREPSDPFVESRQAFSDAPTHDPVDRLVYQYAKTYLQDDILVKVDRASMANSLEVRAPFLDVEFVEFLGRVPARLKLRRFDTKHILKHAMADLLPSGIAGRKKKGFGIPVAEWFKGELREPLTDEPRRSVFVTKGSSSHAKSSACCRSTCPDGATTESSSGRSSCSSSGTASGSRTTQAQHGQSPRTHALSPRNPTRPDSTSW